MSLVDLFTGFGTLAVPSSMLVSGICLDSRLLEVGDLYLAVGGNQTHGLQYVPDVLSKGASAIAVSAGELEQYGEIRKQIDDANVELIELPQLRQQCAQIASRFYGDPSLALQIVAITGTDGKTSVCRFVVDALNALGQQCGYIGTLGWGIDALADTQLTTPDAVSIQRMLASMRAAGVDVVALEASSHGLQEGRLDDVSIDVAVLTNLGRDHLDYHHDIQQYKRAKMRLFEWPSLHSIVLNGDDPVSREILEHHRVPGDGKSLRRIEFHSTGSSSESATDVDLQIQAERICLTETGLEFVLRDAGFCFRQSNQLIGRFNVDNLLACYGVLRAFGHAANDVSVALQSIAPVPGRMEPFSTAGQPTVVVDFAHTPQALAAALDALKQHGDGKLWVVFGCGGDRDSGKRGPMGRAAEVADHIVVTDDNPRTENSSIILQQIVDGMQFPARAMIIADRRQAIAYAVAHATADDLVLLAGKGHEAYQIVGTRKLAYSDRDTARRLLREAS